MLPNIAVAGPTTSSILSSRLVSHQDQSTVPNLLFQYALHALGLSSAAPYPTSLWSILTLPAYIDYCEPNYYFTPYVAELFNTVTNLSFILSALYAFYQCRRFQLPSRFYAIATFILLTGINSALFHATLTWVGLKADETSENLIFVTLIHLHRHWLVTTIHALLATIGVLFFHLLLFCELHIVFVSFVTIQHFYSRMAANPAIRRPFLRGFLLSLAGEACWIMDHVACAALGWQWQLHGWWHVLIGASIHQIFVVAVLVYGRQGIGRSTLAGRNGVTADVNDERVELWVSKSPTGGTSNRDSGVGELSGITTVSKYYLDWLEQGEVVTTRKHS